jgi:prophage regulatory protein
MSEAKSAPTDKLLRFPRVNELTGLSRTTVWRWEKAGKFPKSRALTSRMTVWLESEVLAWMAEL